MARPYPLCLVSARRVARQRHRLLYRIGPEYAIEAFSRETGRRRCWSEHWTKRAWAAALVAEHFGSATVVSRSTLHDTRSLPGLIALDAGERCGLLHYRLDGGELEIVVVIACRPRRGIGRRLLETVEQVAGDQGRRRLWLVTTNDNRPALAFYRAIGWRQCAVHRGAVSEARRLKPQIPLTGHAGIPTEDEIEFERLIDQQPHARE